jgi:hypothetical protein
LDFPSGDIQVYLWVLQCGNIVLLTVRFSDVAKFTTLTHAISCKLPFPIVGIKMSSLLTVALKSLPEISYGILGIYQMHIPVPQRSCPSHNQFYSVLGHERSKQ